MKFLKGYRKLVAAVAFGSLTALPLSAAVSAGAAIQLDDRSTVLWSTAKTGSASKFSIDWPLGASSAELNIYSRGRLAYGPYSVERNGDFSGGYVDVTIPTPQTFDEERVFEAVLSFEDADGNALSAETRTARIAAVMGDGGGVKTVVASGETARGWTNAKRQGRYVVFQIPDAGETLYIDGDAVDTGLDGSAGWFETQLDEGAHSARFGSGETVAFNVSSPNGMSIVIR